METNYYEVASQSLRKWTYYLNLGCGILSQAVQLGSRKRLLAFCEAIQKRCPVGAYIRPVAGATAGYGDEVPRKAWNL